MHADIVRRFFDEVWNQRRADAIPELIGPDGVCHSEQGDLRGPDGFKSLQFDPFTAAFPDVRVTVEDTVADKDTVVVRWSAEGTHTGDGLGIPPTGRRVRFEGVSWIQVKDGKLAEGWQWSNIPTVLATLRG